MQREIQDTPTLMGVPGRFPSSGLKRRRLPGLADRCPELIQERLADFGFPGGIHRGYGIDEGLVLGGEFGDGDSGVPEIIHEILVHLAVDGPLVDGRLLGRLGDHLLVACGERVPELLADEETVRAVNVAADALFFDGFDHVYHPGPLPKLRLSDILRLATCQEFFKALVVVQMKVC